MSDTPLILTDSEITLLIGQRYPLLLVDRVLELDLGESPRIRAIKNLSVNEEVFQGHFPARPILPGAYTIEGVAQCANILLVMLAIQAEMRKRHITDDIKTVLADPGFRTEISGSSKGGFLTSVEMKFTAPLEPGDVLTYELRLIRSYVGMYKLEVEALSGGVTAASGSISVAAVS